MAVGADSASENGMERDCSRLLAVALAGVMAAVLRTGEDAEHIRRELASLSPRDDWYHYWRAFAWTLVLVGSAVALMGSAILRDSYETPGELVARLSLGVMVGSLALILVYLTRGWFVSKCKSKFDGWFGAAFSSGPLDAMFFLVLAGTVSWLWSG
jgi:hypothetical protein